MKWQRFLEDEGEPGDWNKRKAGKRTTDKGEDKIISDWDKWQAKWRTTRILF